jgi:hypothetical protein
MNTKTTYVLSELARTLRDHDCRLELETYDGVVDLTLVTPDDRVVIRSTVYNRTEDIFPMDILRIVENE